MICLPIPSSTVWYLHSLQNHLFWHYFSSDCILLLWQPGSYYTQRHHDDMQKENCAFHKYTVCTGYILWNTSENRSKTGLIAMEPGTHNTLIEMCAQALVICYIMYPVKGDLDTMSSVNYNILNC